jgi:hypothetical protein
MQIIIQELLGIVGEYGQKMAAIPNEHFIAKPNLKQWSKIEVLGHLVDSAQNNQRRFICSQYESPPVLITYDQDFWVAANQYSHCRKEDMIQLWSLLNRRIASILANMSEANRQKNCPIGSGGLKSVEWFAADYVKHLKHHLNQILPGSFDIVYP